MKINVEIELNDAMAIIAAFVDLPVTRHDLETCIIA